MIYVVLPIQKESPADIEKAVGALRVQLSGKRFKIIVVNDGGGRSIFDALNRLKGDDLIYRAHPVTMGMGVILSVGIMAALNESSDPDDIVVTMESSHAGSEILLRSLIGAIEKDNDIVIASRYMKGGRYVRFTPGRMLFSRGVNQLMRRSFPMDGVQDYTIFLRAYRMRILNEAVQYFGEFGLIQAKGFVSNTELLIKLSLFTRKITEIPVQYDLRENKSRSKIKILSSVNEYLVICQYLKRIFEKVRKFRESKRGEGSLLLQINGR